MFTNNIHKAFYFTEIKFYFIGIKFYFAEIKFYFDTEITLEALPLRRSIYNVLQKINCFTYFIISITMIQKENTRTKRVLKVNFMTNLQEFKAISFL